MANRIFFALMILCVATVAEGRTWRLVGGGRAVVGDFQDVKGSDVIIRTNTGGIETIPYAKLTKKDKEVVNSNLISQGRQSDVERLKNGESTDSGKDDKSEGMAGKEGEEASGKRTWTDINGNKLQAELVSVTGLTVQLKTANGEVQTFPISGFSIQDQQFLRTAGGGESDAGVPGAGMPAGGVPGGLPGSGFPGLPNMPGSVNPATGLPGEMPGFPNMGGAPGGMPPGSMPPGSFPGAAMSSSVNMSPGGVPGMSGPMIPPGGASQPGFSGAPGMMPGAFNEMNPSGAPGSMPGGTGFEPGMSAPPGMPQSSAPDFSPPQFNPPQFNPPPSPAMPTFEYVYKCDNCGAEFSEADGVKTGDACPKCSGGSNFRLRGGSVRGLVALAALAAGGIGWAVKKASGKA